MTFLTAGVRWCGPCVLRARERGTVRMERDDDGEPRWVLAHGQRVAGEVVLVDDRGPCHACGAEVSPRWAVRASPRGRGAGGARAPSEGAQRPLPFLRLVRES